MEYRFIEWNGELYIVVGIGYDTRIDPPDVFHAVPIQNNQSLFKTVIEYPGLVKIPFSEAVEITDKKRIFAIWTLFGSRSNG